MIIKLRQYSCCNIWHDLKRGLASNDLNQHRMDQVYHRISKLLARLELDVSRNVPSKGKNKVRVTQDGQFYHVCYNKRNYKIRRAHFMKLWSLYFRHQLSEHPLSRSDITAKFNEDLFCLLTRYDFSSGGGFQVRGRKKES